MTGQQGPFQGPSNFFAPSRAARGSLFSIPSIASLAIALALLATPTVLRAQDSLIWNPSGTGTGSDGSGTWDTTSTNWYDQTASSETSWPTVAPYANATIGDGGVMNGSTDQITIAAPINVGNITFGAMGTGSVDYNLVDPTGGSNNLILNNANTTITSNTSSNITEVSANIVAPSAFTLNVLGKGSMSFGGSIGMSSGSDTGAGALVVGTTGSSTAYTGSLFLLANNNFSSATINSGTVFLTNSGSLGSGPVTMAGGTLSIFQGSIGVNMASSGTNPSTDPPNGSPALNTMSSSLSAGIYSVAQWNNLLIYRNSKASSPTSSAGSTMIGNVNGVAPAGFNTPPGSTITPLGTLTDNSGLLTTAQVTGWQGNNGFSVTGSGTNGNEQMVSSGLNTTASDPGIVTISDIPYASYSVYVYVFNNNPVSGANNANLSLTDNTANNANYYFSLGYKANITSANSSTFTQITGTTNATATAVGSSTSENPGYVVWTNQTGSTDTITLTGPSGAGATGNPWIAGIQIVPNITVPGLVTVSSSSSISLGAYLAQPTFAGGLTIDGGKILTLTNPNSNSTTNLGVLNVTGPTTFAGSGGKLSPGANATFTLGAVTDNGFGFTTTGAGTVGFTTDNISTVSGPVSIGSIAQLEMNASGVGVGSATGTGPLTVTSGGDIFGNGTLANSSVMINSGGEISGPSGTPTNTVTVNSPTIADNGLLTTGAGTLHVVGATTVGSGGAITTGANGANVGTINISGLTTVNAGGLLNVNLDGTVGETMTLSGGANLAGATATYTLRGATTSGQINVTNNNGLAVTGSNTVDAFFVSGQLPTALGQATAYDLLNYSGSMLATSGGFNSPLSFTGAGQGGTINFGYGSPAPSGDVVVPTSYLYQLNNIQSGGVNEIQLVLVNPFNVTAYNGSAGTPGSTFGTAAGWTVNVNSSYAGYVSQSNAQTTGGNGAANGYGPLLTTDGNGNFLYGAILAGNNSGNATSGAPASLQMAWRNRTAQETTSGEGGSPGSPPLPAGTGALIANVLSLTGMSTAGGEPVQTDPFVLQMNYDPALVANETAAAAAGQIYLAWFNPAAAGGNGLWQNATAGNFGPTGGDVGTLGLNFQGNFNTYLADVEASDPIDFPGDPSSAQLTNAELALLMGAYGVDISNHDVWSVLNHNSEFSVDNNMPPVPEPSTIALAIFGLAGIGLAMRRRRPLTQVAC